MLERQQPGLLNPHNVPGMLNPMGASVRGALQPAHQFQPTIEWFFGDKGAGEVDTLNTYGATPTFTRATTAWTKLSTGLWASVASGTPRHFYSGFTTAVGAPLGYLAEGARTNSCLQARDLSNASWTKTSTTGVKNATGIDGTASSASTLTATGVNGTCLQALTIASAAKTFSAFVRRKTGTGDVFITLDNDTTRTDVTADINSTTYTRVSMTQTLANPTVGFKLATDTDAIEVDMVMLEDSASFASTPIPTTTAAVTRNADVLTYPTTGWFDYTRGTVFAEAQVVNVANQGMIFATWVYNDGVGNAGFSLDISSGVGSLFTASGGSLNSRADTSAPTANVSFNLSGAYAENDVACCIDGGTVATVGTAAMPNATTTTCYVGMNSGGVQLFGPIRRVQYFNRRLSNQHLQILTA